jgi:hypothetical protein
MSDGIIFRTTDGGRWGGGGGSGTGGNLTPLQFDENMWAFLTRIQALENNPPVAVSIMSFTVIGSQLQINMTDGSHQGPFTLPIATFNLQGNWVNDMLYRQLDIVSAPHFGLYLVNIQHTSPASPATFDPDAVDTVTGSPTEGQKLFSQLFGEDAYIYDIGFFFPGRPGIGIDDGFAIAGHILGHAITLPQDLPDSTAYMTTAPDASMTFPIQVDGVTKGSLDFASGSHTGTFTFAADVPVDADSRVTLMKPTGGVNAAARELSVTILASRVF